MSVRLEQSYLKEVVKNILYTNEEARNDNDRLYLAVINVVASDRGINLHNMSVPSFFTTRKANKFPTYESVTRSRRKAQEENPMLRANDNVQAMRELREEEYQEWAVKK